MTVKKKKRAKPKPQKIDNHEQAIFDYFQGLPLWI